MDRELASLDQQCECIFKQLYEDRDRVKRDRRRYRKQQLHENRSATPRSPEGKRFKYKREQELPKANDKYIITLTQHLRTMERQVPTGGKYIHLDRAFVHLYYANEYYEQVHQTIVDMVKKLPLDLELELELLWDHSSYKMVVKDNPSLILNSVNMYRIRKKNLCPTLKKSGVKKYRISDNARDHLDCQFNANPKPKRQEKIELSRLTGLRVEIVSNWFKNKRQRCKLNKLRIAQLEGSEMSYTSSIESLAPTHTDSQPTSWGASSQMSTLSEYYSEPPLKQEVTNYQSLLGEQRQQAQQANCLTPEMILYPKKEPFQTEPSFYQGAYQPIQEPFYHQQYMNTPAHYPEHPSYSSCEIDYIPSQWYDWPEKDELN